MPLNRVAMRKIREILRLAWSCGQTRQSIATSYGIGKTTDTICRVSVAIYEWLELLNNRPFRNLPGTSKNLFEELDLPDMLPLPELPYQYAQWKLAKVHIDCHVDVEGHFYSVPFRLVREQVEVRYTSATVECFHKVNRAASHPRSFVKGKLSTNPEHMPPAHRQYADCTPGRLRSWAPQTGKATAAVVESILSRKGYPEHGVRSCMGILSLGKRFGKARLEAACERALHIKGVSYTSIKSILHNNLDQKSLPKQQELFAVTHDNIRGSFYRDATFYSVGEVNSLLIEAGFSGFSHRQTLLPGETTNLSVVEGGGFLVLQAHKTANRRDV